MGKVVKRDLTITKEVVEINKEKVIRLNLGSGYRPIEGFINIDNRECVCPDLVHDIVKDGLPFEDNSIDEVAAMDFLEHVPIGSTIFVVEEIWRVLKPNGKFEHLTPSTDGRGAFQDPTHLSFWNFNSWLYFCNDEHRNLYGVKAKFTGTNEALVTNKIMNIIHDHGILFAVK